MPTATYGFSFGLPPLPDHSTWPAAGPFCAFDRPAEVATFSSSMRPRAMVLARPKRRYWRSVRCATRFRLGSTLLYFAPSVMRPTRVSPLVCSAVEDWSVRTNCTPTLPVSGTLPSVVSMLNLA